MCFNYCGHTEGMGRAVEVKIGFLSKVHSSCVCVHRVYVLFDSIFLLKGIVELGLEEGVRIWLGANLRWNKFLNDS